MGAGFAFETVAAVCAAAIIGCPNHVVAVFRCKFPNRKNRIAFRAAGHDKNVRLRFIIFDKHVECVVYRLLRVALARKAYGFYDAAGGVFAAAQHQPFVRRGDRLFCVAIEILFFFHREAAGNFNNGMGFSDVSLPADSNNSLHRFFCFFTGRLPGPVGFKNNGLLHTEKARESVPVARPDTLRPSHCPLPSERATQKPTPICMPAKYAAALRSIHADTEYIPTDIYRCHVPDGN
mgnify:CR=1 FL=1